MDAILSVSSPSSQTDKPLFFPHPVPNVSASRRALVATMAELGDFLTNGKKSKREVTVEMMDCMDRCTARVANGSANKLRAPVDILFKTSSSDRLRARLGLMSYQRAQVVLNVAT